MRRTWIFLNNTFDINTKNSSVKMLRIANDHDSRLAAAAVDDPTLLPIWERYNAPLLVYRTLMSQRNSGKGSGKGKTQILTEKLDLLSTTWIRAWEVKVFLQYPQGTPEATAIFPQRKAPFQTGPYEERILAVNALKDSLSAYPLLADVKTDVSDKYDMLLEARDGQKQQMSLTGKFSDEVERQRLGLAELSYKNLGFLIDKFGERPTDVERFFDLALLRKSVSDEDTIFNYSDMVAAGETSAVLLPKKLELGINAICNFTNTSHNIELQFFFANNPSAADSPVKITALPGETVETTAAEAGWTPESSVLVVKNSGTMTAEFEVMLMEGVG
ncbi:MAG: hypothetical protein GC192_24760 [Bacteroidetes bacterium]|nr:hypothetical protein [Bacteroidota bacterium]